MGDFIINAMLAKGNSNQIIYFCEYQHTKFQKAAIQSLLNETQYSEDIFGDTIETLAIESSDNLEKDLRLVGLVFKCENGRHKTIVLDNYEILESCFDEMVEADE